METDRQVAVKRAQKLEAELRQKTQECEDFKAQVHNVKSKLTKVHFFHKTHLQNVSGSEKCSKRSSASRSS